MKRRLSYILVSVLMLSTAHAADNPLKQTEQASPKTVAELHQAMCDSPFSVESTSNRLSQIDSEAAVPKQRVNQ